MTRLGFICLVIAGLLYGGQAARILGIVSAPAKSHHFIVLSLLQELATRQHEVTAINFFPQEKPKPNYTDIPLSFKNFDFMAKSNKFADRPTTSIAMLFKMNFFANLLSNTIINDTEVQKLIHSKDEHFDVVIVESFFNEALLGLAHRFKAPIIAMCPFGGTHWMHSAVGNPSPFAYIPDVFLNYGDRMTFIERLHNTLTGVMGIIFREFYYLPQQDDILKKYFKDFGPLPSIKELESRTSLMLVNTHMSISYPRPLVPNVIEVGGLHLKPPKKLPQDLQKYLDDAPNGVIYFSMGSNLKSAEFPEEKRNALLQTFSKLKEKIMWKWETDDLPGKPPNMLIRNWFPQSDILAHPNIKLFITHGGLLSTTEAIYHGVPILGIPVFGDQELNMARAQQLGYGIGINFNNLTLESVQWGLNTIINNPSYRENAKKLSSIFRDQPQSPMERAVYWVEYILRHKGAPHLRSAAIDLYWYQYFLLDVLAVILAAVILSLVLIYILIKTIWKIISNTLPKKPKTTSQKKKK